MRWKRIFLLILLAALAGAGGWFLKVRMEREQPSVAYAEEPRFIGRESTWTFTVEDRRSGLRQIRVWVRQGTEMAVAFSEDLPSAGWWSATGGESRRDVEVSLDPKALGLSDGPATLIVAAQDNSLWGFKGNSTFVEFPVAVDTKPPGINLISTVHNVAKGGTGLVVFRVSEEPERAGVEVDGLFFPAYPEAQGGEGAYVAFFAVPHDFEKGQFALVAADRAGNGSRRPFPVRVMEKGFPRDTMNVSDGFLGRKVPEFQAADPSLSPDLLAAYITVNRDWRARDHGRIREVCAASEGERLWSGSFLQMPNTQNMAPYAVRRTYVHDGKKVDYQVHLGLDLASTAGAPVPAANGGVVKMAGELGIYGQTVIVDHGQGLFSLYAHLSGISVAEGERVDRGQTVGSSGQTGMAGGDHLHFSILVSGEFVNPVEWLDEHWIDDNIENKLDLFASAP